MAAAAFRSPDQSVQLCHNRALAHRSACTHGKRLHGLIIQVGPPLPFQPLSELLSHHAGMVWRIPWMTPAWCSSSWISSPPSAGVSMRRRALCSCSSLTSRPSPTRSCCKAPPPAPWTLLCRKVSCGRAALPEACSPAETHTGQPDFARVSLGEVFCATEYCWLCAGVANTQQCLLEVLLPCNLPAHLFGGTISSICLLVPQRWVLRMFSDPRDG